MSGAGVVTGDALSANALPDLEITTDFPIRGWMWKEMVSVFAELDFFQTAVIKGDFHSQRKLDERTEVFCSLRNEAVVGNAVSVIVLTLIRMLVKLP